MCVTSPAGFSASGIHCGLKKEKLDLALIVSDTEATVAGMFTSNRVQAAPVRYCKEIVGRGTARAIVVNAGNANACTGEKGLTDTREMARLVAEALGTTPESVLVCSTGVIGQPLTMSCLRAGIPTAAGQLSNNGQRAAEAILTTDTVAKTAVAHLTLSGGTVTVGGMAKGSGMIAPDLELPALPRATTLAFLTTDAKVPALELAALLEAAINQTFNRITVDGETSTNDTVLFLANGSSRIELDTVEDRQLFGAGLQQVTGELALAVARDGEGAQRLIEITVKGAASDEDAHRVARTVADSPLVKTAFCAGEPNWGRFMMAIGRSGAALREDEIGIRVGALEVVEGGLGTDHDPAQLTGEMTRDEVTMFIDLGAGPGKATVWTCDLTEEYVRINGRYMT